MRTALIALKTAIESPTKNRALLTSAAAWRAGSVSMWLYSFNQRTQAPLPQPWRRIDYWAVRPPSITTSEPVTNEDSSLAK